MIISTLSACTNKLMTCDDIELNGTTICFDEKLEQYKKESDAHLVVSVDDDKWGEAIVEIWNNAHPDSIGVVTFINSKRNESGLISDQIYNDADIYILHDSEVVKNSEKFLAFDKVLTDTIKDNSVESFLNSVNTTENLVYAPILYDYGLVFVWNKTMLETIGLSTIDANNDNLPDAFDTWEEIFSLSASWYTGDRPMYKGKPIKTVFPLTLNNQWSDYHHLSSTGWQMFENGPLDPGYDDLEFKTGFEFLEDAKASFISVEIAEDGSETLSPGVEMNWRWEDVLDSEIAPFGFLGTWMDLTTAEASTGSDFIVSALPTYNGNHQSTLVNTKGLVISANTRFKSAAHELGRLIYSKEGFQAMVDNTKYAPSLSNDSIYIPTFKANNIQEDLMYGFLYSSSEYFETIPNNKKLSAMSVAYYQSFLNDAQIAIWDGSKSIDQSIADLITISNALLAEANEER
jgi:arabinogalactan oligomer/maltooligosaccharide transport system substrate-binding protein